MLLIFIPFLSYKYVGKTKAARFGGTVVAGTFGFVVAIALTALAVR